MIENLLLDIFFQIDGNTVNWKEKTINCGNFNRISGVWLL